jgi:hypothetical protein
VSPPTRILVILHETGYFRFYGSTIVELARRGWDVRLAFDRPAKRGLASQVPDGATAAVRSVGAIPAADEGRAIALLRAAVDYLRYLEPCFADAGYLRRRSEKTLPARLRFLTRVGRLPRVAVGLAIALMRALERLVAAQRETYEFVRAQSPDVVFVSPLVTLGPVGRSQTECVKAARSLGIPVMVGVASWDHLTSKGLVRVVPDALTVWNEAQAREAVALHRIPRRQVIVSGAQSLDHWFEPAPAGAVARLRAELGIEAGRPVILYVASSRNMAPGDTEPAFVRRWLTALRARAGTRAARAFVIIRPHPGNVGPWDGAAFHDAVVHPAGAYSGIPLRDAEVELFRSTLLVSDVVVGVNTTAMIEAAILERPVLTVRDPAFDHSQHQTVHFAHLAGDSNGCALAAATLDQHVDQLEDVLANPLPRQEAARRFVSTFVRPHGMGASATSRLCDAIERFAVRAPAARSLGASTPREGRGPLAASR